MKDIAAALGDVVDSGARGEAELRLKTVAVDLRFLNRVEWLIEADSAGAVIVFTAVDGD